MDFVMCYSTNTCSLFDPTLSAQFGILSIGLWWVSDGFPEGFQEEFKRFPGPEKGFRDWRCTGNGMFLYIGRFQKSSGGHVLKGEIEVNSDAKTELRSSQPGWADFLREPSVVPTCASRC